MKFEGCIIDSQYRVEEYIAVGANGTCTYDIEPGRQM
jgi:hypothetical protein